MLCSSLVYVCLADMELAETDFQPYLHVSPFVPVMVMTISSYDMPRLQVHQVAVAMMVLKNPFSCSTVLQGTRVDHSHVFSLKDDAYSQLYGTSDSAGIVGDTV